MNWLTQFDYTVFTWINGLMNRFELLTVKNRVRSDFLGDPLAVSLLRGDPGVSGATIRDGGRPASDGKLA